MEGTRFDCSSDHSGVSLRCCLPAGDAVTHGRLLTETHDDAVDAADEKGRRCSRCWLPNRGSLSANKDDLDST